MICQTQHHFKPIQKWKAPRDRFLGKELRKSGNGINAKFAKKDVACENRFSHMDLRELGLELFKAVEERKNIDLKRLVEEISSREPKGIAQYCLQMHNGKVHVVLPKEKDKLVRSATLDEIKNMVEGDKLFVDSIVGICNASGYTVLDIVMSIRNYSAIRVLEAAGAGFGDYLYDENACKDYEKWEKQKEMQLARMGIGSSVPSRRDKVQKILDAKLLRFIQEDANPVKIRKLIEQGADVNVVDTFHNTMIAHAILTGRFKTVKLLLDAGARVVEQSVSGHKTAIGCVNEALEEARANGNLDVYNLVRQKVFKQLREN
ncbi:MAG: hypothetical protein WC488_00630 [Candidatus Micrarchaeia archaeon]